MPENKKRLFYMNRYQVRVLMLVLIPPVIIILTLSVLSNMFFDQLLSTLEQGSTETMMGFLSDWKMYFLLVLWILLTLIVVMTYVVSKNLLGAFTRLFREMDEIIAGERLKMPLKARKRDALANDLLTRINKMSEVESSKP